MFYLLLVGLFWKVSFQPSAFNPSLVSWKLTAESRWLDLSELVLGGGTDQGQHLAYPGA